MDNLGFINVLKRPFLHSFKLSLLNFFPFFYPLRFIFRTEKVFLRSKVYNSPCIQ